mgnify:FL=1
MQRKEVDYFWKSDHKLFESELKELIKLYLDQDWNESDLDKSFEWFCHKWGPTKKQLEIL